MNTVYERRIKRPFDIAASSLTLFIGSAALTLVAAAIRIDSKGPLFYSQERIGMNGKPFQILKFRSMLTLEDSRLPNGEMMANEDRVTRVGKFLRASGLDEIPQLVNVLRGEMSLIGPRPTLAYQVERYTDRQRQRLQVRPGLTGLAQVMGRNELTWEEKIEYDIEYANNVSARMDSRIFFRTFKVIFGGKGVKFKKSDDLSAHTTGYWKDI